MKSSPAARWLLAVIILAGLAGWAVTGLAIYVRLASLGLILLFGAAIWTLLSLRGVSLNRAARSLRASVGELFEEQFELKNSTWPGCAWLEILNQSDLPAASGSRLLTMVGAHQRRFYAARTLLTRRGAFRLGPTSVISGDPFGIFAVHRQVLSSDMLIVLPMMVAIRDFPPPPGLLPGGKAVRLHSMDVTPHAAGVREYVPGDPMKRIHWPSTARRGRFMVKEFEQDPQADIWIFLDAQREVQASLPGQPQPAYEENLWLRRPKVQLPPDTFEYAVSVVASLAGYFLGERRSVGLVCAMGAFTVVPAERGTRQVNKIMETLAFLRPEGKMPLHGLVDMQAKQLPLGSGVILVTSSTRPELLLAAERLQRRSLRPVVTLLEPETFGGSGQSETIAAGLLKRNVPVCRVKYGDDLSVQLALPAVYFQRSYMPRAHFNVQG